MLEMLYPHHLDADGDLSIQPSVVVPQKFTESLFLAGRILNRLREETRIIKMVLSNISIGISSPFSSDLISTTRFRYIKAPRVEMSAEGKAEDAKRRKVQVSKRQGQLCSVHGRRFVYKRSIDTNSTDPCLW